MINTFRATAAALMLMSAPATAETASGVARLTDSSEAMRPLGLTVWYPSKGSASAVISGSAVFEGVAAIPDAPLPEAPLPLVVVSHGGLRSADDSGAWLSAAVASGGFVVVEVNAPRPENAAGALEEVWQRPTDISRAVSRILADETWRSRIDRNRISVVGFALGATAALSIAGAEMNPETYLQSCSADREAGAPDCGWFAAQGVSLTQTSLTDLTRSKRDPRVTAVVAINPEYPGALGVPSEGVAVLHLSLGEGDDARNQAVTIPQASVFDAFAICTPRGKSILLEEDGDASICNTSAEARKVVHDAVLEKIGAFLAHSP